MIIKRIKQIAINFLLIIISLILFFGIGEVFFKSFYPEWNRDNDNFTKSSDGTGVGKIHGKFFYLKKTDGLEIRVPNEDSKPISNDDDQVILIIGDSVTAGFGLAYQDVYWERWRRKLNFDGKKYKLLPLAQLGNNFVDNVEAIQETINIIENKNKNMANVKGIIYLFNLNDITPYRSAVTTDIFNTTRSGRQSPLPVALSFLRGIPILEPLASVLYMNTWKLRVLLGESHMYRVIRYKIYRYIFDNSKVPCGDLGEYGLGMYRYSFGMKGFEDESEKLWVSFEDSVKTLRSANSSIPFFIILSPTSVMIDPNNHVHSLSERLRFDCATIDPVKRLERIAEKFKFSFINPSDYMKRQFDLYNAESNPERFYFIDDSNHFNKSGSEFFSEYTYHEIFDNAY